MRDWLVELRGKESQQKTASAVRVSQSHYAAIETGARRPSVEVAKALGALLGFEWTRFFEEADKGGEGDARA